MLRPLPRYLFHVICFILLPLSIYSSVGCRAIEPEQAELSLFDTPEEAIVSAVKDELGMSVTLKIETQRQDDQWAFLSGLPLTNEGGRIDYSRTRYADDIKEGYFDDGFVGLAQFDKNNKGWSLITLSLGATDAPFVSWPEQFGVPKKIIFPDN